MKLIDNEKREILKLIEVDKPLPDKYRFMPFDDKREVELIWNGKASEVTNIFMSFMVSEQVDEPRKIQPLMEANTRESGKAFAAIRVHSRLKIIRINCRCLTSEAVRNPAGRTNSSGVTTSSFFHPGTRNGKTSPQSPVQPGYV